MHNEVIETMEEESTNLALHTKLCAQRYHQIINKFDKVDGRLTKIEEMLLEIKSSLTSEEAAKYKTYLGWAGVVITALTGVLSHFLLK
jgi:hypothetical protein